MWFDNESDRSIIRTLLFRASNSDAEIRHEIQDTSVLIDFAAIFIIFFVSDSQHVLFLSNSMRMPINSNSVWTA